jgi:tRNA(Ile)-lysidine synthase
LSCSRGDLAEYAQQRDLAWTEDPSNSDQHFERNFLRQEILPRLESRWPEAGKRLQRSGRIAGEAAALLDDLAAIDIASLGDRADRLDIDTLSALPVPRQKNVLRYAIRQLELPTPSAAHLQQILDELIPARDDAAPMVRWQGVEIRRYREHLYVLPAVAAAAPADPGRFAVNDAVCLDAGLGLIRLEAGASEGLSGDLVQRGLELRYRHGGEKFKPQGQAHTRKLKKLLQEAGVVPWMRDRIPLLYCDNELVAVADLWLAADAASRPGVAIRWENRPPIH